MIRHLAASASRKLAGPRTLLAVAALVALAACGVDGEPTPPGGDSGVTISGEARIGVSGRL